MTILNSNPYFETDASGWSAFNGATLARSTAQKHEGAASLLITPNGVSAVPLASIVDVAVTVGQSYTMSGWLRSTNGRTLKVGIYWKNASFGIVSTDEVSQALSAGVWTQYTATFTAPVGASYAALVTNDPGTPAAVDTWYADEMTLLSLAPTVEIFYSGSWHDITSDVLVRNNITITHGRTDPTAVFGPSTLDLSIKNPLGKYSPRNSASPLYGLIGRNTPIRVYTGSPPVTTSEDFEDTSFTFTTTQVSLDYPGVNLSTTQHHGGSKSLQIHAGSLADLINIVVPVGSKTMSFWVYTANTGSPYALVVDFDGVRVWNSGSVQASAWNRIGPFNVSGVTNIRMYGLGDPFSGITDAYVDDLSITSGGDVRFVGEVESWPQRWDLSGAFVSVPVKAYGVLRRVGGWGSQLPVQAPIYRYLAASPTNLRGYWPLDGGQQSTQGLPVVGTGNVVMNFFDNSSTGSWSAGDLNPWTTGVLAVKGAVSLSANMPGAKSGSNMDVVVAMLNDPPQATDTCTIDLYLGDASVAGGIRFNYVLEMKWTTGTRSMILYREEVVSGTRTSMVTYSSGLAGLLWNGSPHLLGLDLVESGGNITASVTLDGSSLGGAVHTGAALWTGTNFPQAVLFSGDGIPGGAWGHLSLWQGNAAPNQATIYSALTGYQGETTDARINRIAGEEGISHSTVTGSTSATVLGPQITATVPDLFTDAANADGGMFLDDRTALATMYLTGPSLMNQAPDFRLDYSNKEVAPPLEPVEDTSSVVNDVTVTRRYGGKARSVQTTGPLNVSLPSVDPKGVGRYSKSVELGLSTDNQAATTAAFLLTQGTVDEPRFPSVTVDLTALAAAGKTSLISAVVAADVGGRIVIQGLPAWVQGDWFADQLIQGYTEVIGSHHRTITFATSPQEPYGGATIYTLSYADGKLTGQTLAQVTTAWTGRTLHDIDRRDWSKF